MGYQQNLRRYLASAAHHGRRAAHAASDVLRTADRVVQQGRSVYELARPLLHSAGVVTGPVDRRLMEHDRLRPHLANAANLLGSL